MHGVSRCLYMITRKPRFLAGSVLKLMNTQVHHKNQIPVLTWEPIVYDSRFYCFRQLCVWHGLCRIIRSYKIRLLIIRLCLVRLIHGYCIGCDRERIRPSMSNTLLTSRAVRQQVSTIHSRWAGPIGRSKCFHWKAKWCRVLLRIRTTLVMLIDRYLDTRLRSDAW